MALIFGSKTTRATGGISTTTFGAYTLHTFTSSTNFTPTSNGMIDILAIGSGGAASPGGQPYYNAGGGGAGATVYKKFQPVIAGTPYTITIGTNGSATSFGSLVTAPGGGSGGYENGAGTPAPGASGGGGGSNTAAGTGAGVYGLGFPGAGPGAGGGGGAGGAGTLSPGQGGPGVPIAYFVGFSTIVSVGGPAGSVPEALGITSTSYGSGATVRQTFSFTLGRPGVAYIRYI